MAKGIGFRKGHISLEESVCGQTTNCFKEAFAVTINTAHFKSKTFI